MYYFLVTLRKAGKVWHFLRPAFSSASAYDLVAAEQGNDVFGITVVPA
jgi:hypothetical protein